MVLVHISMLPHGAMILEPNDSEISDIPPGCFELCSASHTAAQELKRSAPDTIILITPHGIIYLNDHVSGNAEWNSYGEQFKVNYDCDGTMADLLISHLLSDSIKADGVTVFAKSCHAPLRWGEVVPLWFLHNAGISSRIVVVSLPQSRYMPLIYAESASLLGESLFNFCESQLMRIALVFSSDLSHVHSVPPTISSKYHCVPSLGTDDLIASSFDNLVVRWASELLVSGRCESSNETLKSDMAKLVMEAKACGWSGMCCIQSCLKTADETGRKWSGTVHEYRHPSYYGMMVATAVLE